MNVAVRSILDTNYKLYKNVISWNITEPGALVIVWSEEENTTKLTSVYNSGQWISIDEYGI